MNTHTIKRSSIESFIDIMGHMEDRSGMECKRGELELSDINGDKAITSEQNM